MKSKMNYQLLLLLVVLLIASSAVAQDNDQLHETRAQLSDPIRELNLTPEQRAQIRALRQENQDERNAINRRLREANQALQQALDAENPDEALVEQRVRDVAAIQASHMRLRVLSEVRIRRVLTAQQRALLRQLRVGRRPRRDHNEINPRREGLNNLRRFPNRRNRMNSTTPPTRP